jgi:inosine-uridine nucleoside N-ribohydrolase
MASQEKLVIVSVGGLTNVAVALKKNPAIRKKIERFVIMGGCVHAIEIQGKRLPDRIETNLHNDVDAAAVVLRSGVPVTLVPAEITFQTKLLRRDFERIQKTRTPLAEALSQMTLVWEPIMKGYLNSVGVGGYYADGVVMLHDPLAVAALVAPKLMKIERQRIRLEVKTGTIRTIADPEGPITVDLVVSADVVGLSRLVTDCVVGDG